MTLKRFLLLPLIISLALFAYFSEEVVESFGLLMRDIDWTASSLAVIAAAVILQIAGHCIRAYKMRFLLAPVTGSTTRFQLRALSIGYLFNALLPLRLGELIRAQVIAGGEKLSFGFALTLIVIERAVDAAFLTLLGVVLLVFRVISADVLGLMLLLFLLGAVALALIWIVGTANRRYLASWHGITELFNGRIKQSLRFKAWTITYGIQRVVTRRRIGRYLALTATSWLLYSASVLILVLHFLGGLNFAGVATLTVSPYYGLALPAGPASLGTFSNVVESFTAHIGVAAGDLQTFSLVAWGVLIGPVSLLGLVFLLTKTNEQLWRRLPRQATSAKTSEKLFRTADISQEFDGFLDNYFSGNNLSQIIHRLELQKDFRLLKYFKGGSDAITILALQNNETVVKKVIPAEFTNRLKAQYDWLQTYKTNRGIVSAIREHSGTGYYAIDLEYDDQNEMFFDYLHRSSQTESRRIMATVWDYLNDSLYKKTKQVSDPDALKQYIDTHIFACMDKAALVDHNLITAAQPEKIVINGRKYDNFYTVMDRIMNNQQAMQDLSTYARSKAVHGDVAVDNILVSQKTGIPLLIDPAPDGNIINGPVFDFGKNMQSLYCGYEFLFRGNETVKLGNDGSIRFQDQRSTQYKRLCDYVRNELAPKYLSEGEQKAIIFHAAALHIRRLKHQVYQNPANVLAIYAVGVKTLNDFIRQYEKKQQ